MGWLVKAGRVGVDPLGSIERVDMSRREQYRRAFTPDELAQLRLQPRRIFRHQITVPGDAKDNRQSGIRMNIHAQLIKVFQYDVPIIIVYRI